MGEFKLVGTICQNNFCPGVKHLQAKKPVDVGEMKIHLHSTAIIQILAHFSTSL